MIFFVIPVHKVGLSLYPVFRMRYYRHCGLDVQMQNGGKSMCHLVQRLVLRAFDRVADEGGWAAAWHLSDVSFEQFDLPANCISVSSAICTIRTWWKSVVLSALVTNVSSALCYCYYETNLRENQLLFFTSGRHRQRHAPSRDLCPSNLNDAVIEEWAIYERILAVRDFDNSRSVSETNLADAKEKKHARWMWISPKQIRVISTSENGRTETASNNNLRTCRCRRGECRWRARRSAG